MWLKESVEIRRSMIGYQHVIQPIPRYSARDMHVILFDRVHLLELWNKLPDPWLSLCIYVCSGTLVL